MDDTALTTAASRFSNELHLQIGARPTGQVMLLLDPVLRPVAQDDTLAEKHDAWLRTPVKLAPHRIDASHRPYLLELDANTPAGSDYLGRSVHEALAELQPEALRTGAGRRIGGWLASAASAKQVALHLASVMIQHRENGSAVWLRLQDPAVLWWVWSLLEPAQRQELLGPIEVFWLPDPAGRLIALHGAPDKQQPAEHMFFRSLELNPQQWQDIGHIQPLNVALREWGGAAARPERLEHLCAAARNALRRAHAHGFGDPHDLAAYARCALEVHPSFDLHPRLRERIEARDANDCFTSLIDDFEQEDWRRIARECETELAPTPSRRMAS